MMSICQILKSSAIQGYAKRFPSIGEGNYRPAYACAESNGKIKLKAEQGTCYIYVYNKHEHTDGTVRHPNGHSFSPNNSYGFSIARIFNIRSTTIAHELGHILGLPHVFEKGDTYGHRLCYDNSADTFSIKYSTMNLLDYQKGEDGSDLRKYFNKKQIDHIYNNIHSILYKVNKQE